jgi:tetratricopeptide (TPR) repeat protein
MISAFRSSVDYDAVAIFNDFGSEEEFKDVLLELVDRGLLFREEKSFKFDMHPIMRRYCYGRLKGKEIVHSRLMYYFARIPESEKVESVDDLVPVIELYHHTVRAGCYDVARELYRDRLAEQLYFKFGAYQTIIELLRALFPDGEDKLPRLEKESSQAWTLAEVANSYSLYGQPRRAALFYERHNKLREKTSDGMNLTTGLVNLAYQQTMIGELDAAESNLRQVEIGYGIVVCEERREAIAHRGLGLLLSYRGKFKASEEELTSAVDIFRRRRNVQSLCMVQAYRSIRSLLMSNAKEALSYAINARKLADVKHYERDIIQAGYILGAAYLMKGNLVDAEKHLTEALTRDRKINLVEFEPDILLEFAKLRLKQNHKEEALKFAEEALQIADRCEYRLKQADIHNFLAEFYLDAGDLEKAKEHGEIAKERAECGYKVALEKAKKMLNEIERG